MFSSWGNNGSTLNCKNKFDDDKFTLSITGNELTITAPAMRSDVTSTSGGITTTTPGPLVNPININDLGFALVDGKHSETFSSLFSNTVTVKITLDSQKNIDATKNLINQKENVIDQEEKKNFMNTLDKIQLPQAQPPAPKKNS